MSEDYKPVPVAAAREIAERFEKQVVVVFAIDDAHDKSHVTTFGADEQDKHLAAALGTLFSRVVGVKPIEQEFFEDFRLRQWIEGPFCEALHDKSRLQTFGAMIKIGLENGDPPEHFLAIAICNFVMEVAGYADSLACEPAAGNDS